MKVYLTLCSLLFACVTFAQEITKATLSVSVSPAATVSLNHQPGTRGETFTFTVNADEPTLLKVSEPGYITEYRTLQLLPGARGYERFNLKRETIPVLFRSNVPSTILHNGAVLGTTPCYAFFDEPTTYRIAVQAQGYQPQMHSLNLTNGKPMIKHYDLRSNSGAIAITSNPSGATIFLDGIKQGTTPRTLEKLRENEYTLTLQKAGYKNVSHTLKVTAGETAPIALTLERLPSGLTVSTIPNEARIYLDGAYQGLSDLALGELGSGKHTIRVEKTGYATHQRTVTLEAGKTHVEEFRLVVVRGELRVQTSPAVVAVYHGNKKLFETAPEKPYDVTSRLSTHALAPGKYNLTFKAEGYAETTREVTITANTPTTLQVALVFKPNFEVRTKTGKHTGVLILKDANGNISIETKPGLKRTFMADEITGWKFIQD